MAKVYVFLANGFEDVEALIPVDVLRRGGVKVITVSITGDSQVVETAHNVQIVADAMIEDCDFSDADLLFLPGGMPGASNLYGHEGVRQAVLAQVKAGKNQVNTATSNKHLVLCKDAYDSLRHNQAKNKM